jgi:hypothetical protein
MNFLRVFFLVLALGVLIGGCSQQDDLMQPENGNTVIHTDKDGTEYLGPITIADGSCFAEGGVGMVDTDTGTLDITVPIGATVEQVLLYWMGGTTAADGDNEIEVDGNPVTGTLIGGATNFFGDYDFRAYRADVTAEGWVVAGPNSFTITGFDFDFSGGDLDENNGAGMIVIYDDGTEADLQLFDGLDMAFFKFSPTLDATVPVTFDFAAEPADRMSKFVVLAGSVGENRPNTIKATTSLGEQVFDNPLGSMDGMLFDSITLDIVIPAGDTQLSVQLFSTVSEDPLGASLGWIGTGLSVPVTPPPELACLGDYVWHDLNMDGIQDDGEVGIAEVYVDLMDCNGQVLASTMTDIDGKYLFCDLEAGDYNVHFVLQDGYVFSPMDQGGDDAVDSDADPSTGMTVCTTLEPGETDLTWDAGMYMPVVEDVGCRFTGGGNSTFVTDSEDVEVYTFGGQAGAPLASQPQPWGNWTHHQKKGPSGYFVFHAGTPSAPEGTEIDWISCMDPGWCVQARKAPAKQLDFGGVGTFKNMKGDPEGIAEHVNVGESLHWFEVNIDDLGEPGGHDNPGGCDPLGFGRNGGTELADCECPDFYRIRIYTGMTDATEIMYEVFGYIDNGNFQLHPPTGRDSKLLN